VLDLSGNRLTRRGMRELWEQRGGRPVTIDVSQNVQSAGDGDAPVAVSDLVPGVLNRLAHPRTPPAGG
jgi:hypothetical protein